MPGMASVSKSVELLRFSTCGSVDDGKSTLIGRLLHDSKSVFEDQLQALERVRENSAARPRSIWPTLPTVSEPNESRASRLTLPIAILQRRNDVSSLPILRDTYSTLGTW